MFENYSNLENYIPNNSKRRYSRCVVKKPLAIYNIFNNIVGYEWTSNDKVVLDFTVSGFVVDEQSGVYQEAKDFIADKIGKLRIFNSERMLLETIIHTSINDDVISFELNEPLCKGFYYITLELYTPEDLYIATIFKSSELSVIVR